MLHTVYVQTVTRDASRLRLLCALRSRSADRFDAVVGISADTALLPTRRCLRCASGASAPQMPSAPDRKAERLVSQPHAARRRSKDIEGQDQEVRGQNEELRRQLDEAPRLRRKSNPDERDAWTNERARAAAC